MNLFTKTTLINVFLIFAVFSIGGIISFQIFQSEVNKETDYHLKGQLKFIKNVIERGAPVSSLNYNRLSIVEIDSSSSLRLKPQFSDTLVYRKLFERTLPHRKVEVDTKINQTWYKISLFETIVEEDDIMDSVTSSLSYTFAILVSLLIILSILLSTWLFSPFKRTLNAIDNFRIHSDNIPELPRTGIKEFTQLNLFLTGMMEKSRRDYVNLKEFIENSSHEIQTPLAIARGKLELLMEHEDLDAYQAHQIQVAYSALTRLSKLNNSLGLLSKIDNQEFSNPISINISQRLRDKLVEFEELISLKEIELDTEIQSDIWLNIDPLLWDILLSNLLQNAIKHNYIRGRIQVRLADGTLRFTNTGAEPKEDPKQFFARFKKGSNLSDSHGLGLAIAKKVCDVSQMDISYTYSSELHHLRITFSPVPRIPQKPTPVPS